MRPIPRLALAAATCGLLAPLAAPGPARAGVTIETRIDVAMLGGGGQGSGTVEIEGRARREVRSIALQGSGADLAPSERSEAITRLDRGLQWQLDPDDSTYRAVALAGLGRAPGGMRLPGLAPGAAAGVTWTVEVTPRPESALIAGCRARRTDIVLTGTSHDPDAGAAGTIRLATEWWMATRAPGAAEQLAFERGFERATHGIGSDVPGLLAGLPGAADAVARLTAARRGLAGVPMRTVLRLEAPGLAAMLGQALGGGDSTISGGGAGASADDAGPLVTSTIEVTSMRVGPIAPGRFALPKGYREAKADAPQATPREVHE